MLVESIDRRCRNVPCLPTTSGAPNSGATTTAVKFEQGFSLVELLVVIAIVALLTSLLLPAVRMANESARSTYCKNSLRQIGLALSAHASARGERLPPGGVLDPVTQSNYLGWSIAILPFLEHQPLYDQYHLNEPNESPKNSVVQSTLVSDFMCPADAYPNVIGSRGSGPGSSQRWAPGSYRAMTGRGPDDGARVIWFGNYFADEYDNLPWEWRGPLTTVGNPGPLERTGTILTAVRLSEIEDGLSHTLIVGERCLEVEGSGIHARRTAWSCSYGQYNKSAAHWNSLLFERDFEECERRGGGFVCFHGWSSYHVARRTNFAYCDGHVDVIAPDVDLPVFVSQSTIAGGDETFGK